MPTSRGFSDDRKFLKIMLLWRRLVSEICSLALPSSGRPSGPVALCIDFIAGWRRQRGGRGGGREGDTANTDWQWLE